MKIDIICHKEDCIHWKGGCTKKKIRLFIEDSVGCSDYDFKSNFPYDDEPIVGGFKKG